MSSKIYISGVKRQIMDMTNPTTKSDCPVNELTDISHVNIKIIVYIIPSILALMAFHKFLLCVVSGSLLSIDRIHGHDVSGAFFFLSHDSNKETLVMVVVKI